MLPINSPTVTFLCLHRSLVKEGMEVWLKVSVDPRSREVFSYQPQIVPSNRVAVPAP